MRLMPISDAMFLVGESREMPMHIGGINLYTLPDDVDETDWLNEQLALLRQAEGLRRPFSEVLKLTPLGQYGPIRLEPDRDIDMHYHVRAAALPKPGRYREMFELASRLHSGLLDRTRPLWEITLISGLPNRQIATFKKVHHALMDGAASIHFYNSMLSPDPKERRAYSPLSVEAYEAYKRQFPTPKKPPRPNLMDIKAIGDFLKEQWGNSVGVTKAMNQYLAAMFGIGGDGLVTPFAGVPRTSFNRNITGARRFVAQSWSLERVRAVGKAYGGTINDAVLGMCAGAMRKYLQSLNELPDKPLKAMAPVSIRPKDDIDSGNSVASVTANLATHIDDPAERMAAIQESMNSAKAQLRAMTAGQIQLYTALTSFPMMLTALTKTADKFPAYSVTISNVPGPREQMYWNGARLDGMYPASIPVDGMAMNITQVSNFKNIDFGITACRRSVPHAQRMIDYLEEALVELEAAAGIKTPKGK
ncbi:MAG: WS/DGAT/MGAT family O-acyltransferase [Sphingopyxis sp.]